MITRESHQWRIEIEKTAWLLTCDDNFYYIICKIPAGVSHLGSDLEPILFDSEEDMILYITENDLSEFEIQDNLIL